MARVEKKPEKLGVTRIPSAAYPCPCQCMVWKGHGFGIGGKGGSPITVVVGDQRG